MASTKALLVYTTGNRIHQHYVLPDDDAQMTPAWIAQFVGPGQSSIVVTQAELVGVHPSDVLVAHGIQPAWSGRLAVIDSKGNVVSAIIGDHALLSIPGQTLHPTDRAGPGDTFDTVAGFTLQGRSVISPKTGLPVVIPPQLIGFDVMVAPAITPGV